MPVEGPNLHGLGISLLAILAVIVGTLVIAKVLVGNRRK
jgi:hypothetical protein